MNCVVYTVRTTFGDTVNNCLINDQFHVGAVTLVDIALDNSDKDTTDLYNTPSFFNECSKYLLLQCKNGYHKGR